jgi:uncharacterized protein YggE
MKRAKICSIVFVLLLTNLGSVVKAQNVQNENLKFIEVVGSSEMEIDPDEIRFIIGIKEYWLEEFNKKAEYKDYKTKVKIDAIETELLNTLSAIGISKKQIIIKSVGNYWRNIGKEFLVSKEFEIILTDAKIMDEIVGSIDTKGVNYMRIGELKNKKTTEYRKQVKIEALKMAKEKASYLLESVGEQIGRVISIIEIENGNENHFWQPQPFSNLTINPSDNSDSSDNFKKIKVRYEMKVRFEIK